MRSITQNNFMADASSKKILVVEDEAPLRNAVADILTFENFQVLQAINGQEGLVLALKEHPDLILLDLMMPGMDGFGFLKKVKEIGGLSIPVIVCSNISDVDTINRAIKEGAEAVILKVDYSGKQLVDKVNSLVEEYYHKKTKVPEETP